MKNFVEHFGPWALVTGASSGIGEAFARRLAECGLNLVLAARREDRLRNLAEELQSKHSVNTRVIAVDLSQDDLLPVIRQGTADLEIGLLVNNAGIAATGNFLDHDLDSELKLLQVNNRATLILAHYLGRSMRQRGRGGMIFVSSILAFAGVPLWSNYAASKAYDLLLAEGLAKELHEHGISVLALCPGATQSEIWPAGANPGSSMQPQAVVDVALKNLGRKTTVVAGWNNALTVFATRLLPRSWNTIIFGRVIGGMLKGVHTPSQARPEVARAVETNVGTDRS